MKDLSVKGLEELRDFKKRLCRLAGMGRVEDKEFERLHKKINDLISDVEDLD